MLQSLWVYSFSISKRVHIYSRINTDFSFLTTKNWYKRRWEKGFPSKQEVEVELKQYAF